MQEILITISLVLAIFILYYVFVYNRLQRLLNNVEEASSGIDVVLNKRYDLISNLLNVVKGYSEHEKEVFEKVAMIRNNLNTARDVANEQMQEVSDQIMLIVESYPQLKASEQFLNLQKNLSNVEEHLQAARRLYNRSVTQLNNAIKSFPTNIIAKNHNIKTKLLFATKADLQENVEIKF